MDFAQNLWPFLTKQAPGAAEHFDFRAFGIAFYKIRRRPGLDYVIQCKRRHGHSFAGGFLCNNAAQTAVGGNGRITTQEFHGA